MPNTVNTAIFLPEVNQAIMVNIATITKAFGSSKINVNPSTNAKMTVLIASKKAPHVSGHPVNHGRKAVTNINSHHN